MSARRERPDVCGSCGIPYDEMPFDECHEHSANYAALRRLDEEKKLSHQIRNAGSFFRLRAILAKHFEEEGL